jgi:hypothetical protein
MRRATLLLALAVLLAATVAVAYVQDRSPRTGAALRWKGGVLTLTLARTSPSQDLRESEVRQTVAAALAVWDRRNNPCSSVELRLAAGTTDNEVVEDGISSISFREERWGRNSAVGDLARYPANMVALTSLYAKPRSSKPTVAEIVEADIELNAVDFRFSTYGRAAQNPTSRTRDLQTVLVHEIGPQAACRPIFWGTLITQQSPQPSGACPHRATSSVGRAGPAQAPIAIYPVV